jgi:hypothetical protein
MYAYESIHIYSYMHRSNLILPLKTNFHSLIFHNFSFSIFSFFHFFIQLRTSLMTPPPNQTRNHPGIRLKRAFNPLLQVRNNAWNIFQLFSDYKDVIIYMNVYLCIKLYIHISVKRNVSISLYIRINVFYTQTYSTTAVHAREKIRQSTARDILQLFKDHKDPR